MSDQRGHLYMVADGVGGAEMGMQTAQKIADNLTRYFLQPVQYPKGTASVLSILNETNAECHSWGHMENSRRTKAGAAVSILHLLPELKKACVYHVGDTVVYHLSPNRDYCATKTHNVADGMINFIGVGEHFVVDTIELRNADEGDMFVLVSDGVTKAIRDDQIIALANDIYPPERAAQELAERARRKGSRDDITAIVVELEEW